jgi:hypothetical protein
VAAFNRWMRKTARPVVWEGAEAQSSALDPIDGGSDPAREKKEDTGMRLELASQEFHRLLRCHLLERLAVYGIEIPHHDRGERAGQADEYRSNGLGF